MKRKLFQRRFPTYLVGATLGLILVLFVSQMKKAFAPEFQEIPFSGEHFVLELAAPLHLDLGENPGHSLAWGFPTKLAIGKKNTEGKISPLKFFEYKDLVEPNLRLGEFSEAGDYEITGQFYACAKPGEKYCANLKWSQTFSVREGGEKEKRLTLPIQAEAERMSREGAAREQANPTGN
jgi:hypothetical protein